MKSIQLTNNNSDQPGLCCDMCGERFRRPAGLERHIQICQGKKRDMEEQNNSETEESMDECEVTDSEDSSYEQETETDNTDEGEVEESVDECEVDSEDSSYEQETETDDTDEGEVDKHVLSSHGNPVECQKLIPQVSDDNFKLAVPVKADQLKLTQQVNSDNFKLASQDYTQQFQFTQQLLAEQFQSIPPVPAEENKLTPQVVLNSTKTMNMKSVQLTNNNSDQTGLCCDMCGERFSRPAGLERHIQMCQGKKHDTEEQNNSETEESMNECEVTDSEDSSYEQETETDDTDEGEVEESIDECEVTDSEDSSYEQETETGDTDEGEVDKHFLSSHGNPVECQKLIPQVRDDNFKLAVPVKPDQLKLTQQVNSDHIKLASQVYTQQFQFTQQVLAEQFQSIPLVPAKQIQLTPQVHAKQIQLTPQVDTQFLFKPQGNSEDTKESSDDTKMKLEKEITTCVKLIEKEIGESNTSSKDKRKISPIIGVVLVVNKGKCQSEPELGDKSKFSHVNCQGSASWSNQVTFRSNVQNIKAVSNSVNSAEGKSSFICARFANNDKAFEKNHETLNSQLNIDQSSDKEKINLKKEFDHCMGLIKNLIEKEKTKVKPSKDPISVTIVDQSGHMSSLFDKVCQASRSYKCRMETSVENFGQHRESHSLNNVMQSKFGRQVFINMSATRCHETKDYPNVTKPKIIQRSYKCDKCDEQFYFGSNLKNHLALKHKLYKYKCSTCMKKFLFEKVFEMHTCKNLECEDMYAFCHVCGKKVKKKYFKRHMQLHEPKSTRCSLCPRSKMRTNLSLERHMAKVHGSKNLDEKKFTCEYCGKAFASNPSLKTHIVRHQGIKAYKCNLCDKAYYSNNSLTLHKRSAHTKERPFGCSYCQAAFTGPTNLQDHIRIHTGEKPYVCPACKKAFAKSCNMKKHIKLVHKN